jgi:hypothetical protein
MNASLGARLANLKAMSTSAESDELHRRASAKGPCAVEDLNLVELFFRDAALSFATAIMSDVLPRRIAIGRGCYEKVAGTIQTFRWKSGFDIRSNDHPYHAIWNDFATWCDGHGLEPTLDGSPGPKETMYFLNVQTR